MATWPATLPRPDLDGYGLDPVPQTLETDMESGASRSRRVTKARNDRVNVAWKLTDAQMTIFRAWFDNDAEAAGGAAWFYIDLAIGTGGLDTVEAKFRGPFRAVPLPGINWHVSGTLEVR